MPELSKTHMGGTMRLGLRKTVFKPNTEWSAIRKLYGNNSTIEERHRHRYEVNPDWVQKVEDHGFIFTGRDESGQRMQVAELQGAMPRLSGFVHIGSPPICTVQDTHILWACRRIQNSALGHLTPRLLSWALWQHRVDS